MTKGRRHADASGEDVTGRGTVGDGEPQEIHFDGFVEQVKTIQSKSPGSSFLFLLGSGASRQSGIKTGGDMVADWLDILRINDPEHEKVAKEEWATADRLGIDSFDPSDRAACYPQIFKKTFAGRERQGFDYLEHEIAGKAPSWGYSVLAQILDKTRHKVVVTTNFDNLVADALSIFTTATPMVCGHESLAGFISSRPQRPQVVKVHRDLFYAPKTTPEDLGPFDKSFEKSLRELFAAHVPIVIGYGGNDGSLMKVLENMESDNFDQGLYWCYHRGHRPRGRILELVAKLGGWLVPIPSFDELMLRFQGAFELRLLDEFMRDRGEERANAYKEQREQLAKGVKARADVKPDSSKAVSESDRETARSSLDVIEMIMKRGIEADPKDADNLGTYANFLTDIRKDHAAAETMYKRAIQADPKDADNLGNYAVFLKNVREDCDAAEAMFRRALEAAPKRANSVGNYAYFLDSVCKDHDAAEAMYKRAIEADPNHANNLGNYAVFLEKVREDSDAAEAMYKRAIKADPKHASNIGNYALFLTDVRKDHGNAEAMYKRAIDADPSHANSLGAYALFLEKVREDSDAAEVILKRAIEADPKHAANLSNYAVFLMKMGEDYDAADAMFKQAIEADPMHADILGNYANFLTEVVRDHDGAEAMYKRAIEANPRHADNLGGYANLQWRVRENHDSADAMYKRAIEADPKNANSLGNYAAFLTNIRHDQDGAETMYKLAIDADPKNANVLGNYAVFLSDVQENHDDAEAMYKRAIEADLKHINSLGNYALFLAEVRKDHDAAVAMWKRAIEADPKSANNLGNYARFLMAVGRMGEGLGMLDQAMANLDEEHPSEVNTECWMYAYCCRPVAGQAEALARLKRLITQGKVRTGDWDFSGVIGQARAAKHSAVDWLGKLAEVLGGRAEAGTLEEWSGWRDA